MKQTKFDLKVTGISAVCPIGETVGERNIKERKIPVMSCEGACIRGEIARLAANQVAQASGYARACHGELHTVPHSAMARWVRGADRIVIIDGCHLRCAGRVVENMVQDDKLLNFNAHSRHQKYSDLFGIDEVPEGERKEVAHDVAEWVTSRLQGGCSSSQTKEGESTCCSCSTE